MTTKEEKSLGQIAYEEYTKFQHHIPRLEIWPVTWQMLGTWNNGELQKQWETIAQAVAAAARENDPVKAQMKAALDLGLINFGQSIDKLHRDFCAKAEEALAAFEGERS